MMKRYLKGLCCAALSCALLKTTACAILPQEEVLPDAPIMRQVETDEFTMTYVQYGDLIHEQRINVKFRAVRQEQLKFDVDGLRFEEVHVSKGDSVQKGQLLMELEQSDLAQQSADAAAQCESLRLQVAQAEEKMELSRDEYALQLAYMTDEEREKAEPMEEHLLSQTRSLEKLKNQLTIARENAQRVENEISKRQLRAGIDGVVTLVRSIAPSDVSSRHQVMVTISDTESSMFLIETTYTDLYEVGMELTVYSNGNAYPCRVISPEEAGAHGMDEIYLRSDVPTADLADGDSGYLMLVTERYDDVLYVEKNAVMSMNGEHYVYIQDENGFRSIHPVQIGESLDGYIEIVSGLKEGDQIILK